MEWRGRVSGQLKDRFKKTNYLEVVVGEVKVRIKITGCRLSSFWYSDRIGKEYTAVRLKGEYRVDNTVFGVTGFVDSGDCVEVKNA